MPNGFVTNVAGNIAFLLKTLPLISAYNILVWKIIRYIGWYTHGVHM